MAETDDTWTPAGGGVDPGAPQVKSSLLQRLLDRYGMEPPPPLEKDRPGSEASSAGAKFPGGKPSDELRYVYQGEIGRGGMGAVLRVFDQHLRRTLAMKVLRTTPKDSGSTSQRSTSPALARLLEEAQITSQLEHPGVVPVHELGLDENHQVYFTMRLVRGRSLKEVLTLAQEEREGWTLTRALGVLLKVCETMSYAHDRGVIHRDLKPANIMVGQYGEVYVMDWGLARVVGREDLHDIRPAPEELSSIHTDRRDLRAAASDSPLITLDGTVLGTPAFMSPEQASGNISEVDRSSDVYAVGALLYNLLTGLPPYLEPDRHLASYAILALVLQGPPKPLHVLAAHVHAELAAICERAMARNPALRYPSMSALADDLRAYLEGRVVSAYETGALAEARKWVQRNRALAGSLAAALLLALAGISGVGYVEARSNAVLTERAKELQASNTELEQARLSSDRNRTEAERQAAIAGSEARTTREALRFLTDMFEEQRPVMARGRQVTVAEVLDRSARRLEHELRGEPGVRARLTGSMGQVYASLGLYAEALPLLEESLSATRARAAEDAPETLSALSDLGELHMRAGRYAEAEPLLERALDLRREKLGQEQRDTLTSQYLLATLRHHQGRVEQSFELQQATLEARRRLFGDEDIDTIDSLHNLAACLRDQGRLEEAREALEQVLDAQARLLSEDDPDKLFTMSNLASVHLDLGDVDLAEELLDSALALRRKVLPPDHPDQLDSLQVQAAILSRRGRLEEALTAFEDLLPRRVEVFGPREPRTLQCLFSIAQALNFLGRRAEAQARYEQYVDLALDTLPFQHAELRDALYNLAGLLQERGDLEQAASLARELLERTPADSPARREVESLARGLGIEPGG